MTRFGVATPTTTKIKLIATTNASTASASYAKVHINLRSKNSSGGGSGNEDNNNNNSNTINQTSAGQSKYLTWYKIVSEHNNNDNYTYKSDNNNNEDNNSKSSIAATTARRNEQIGNVDGNAGGNGSAREAHTGNANKSRISRSENSYDSVNKFVLATNERRSVRRRHVNKSLVNSVNKSSNKNKRQSKNGSHASAQSSQVRGEIEKGQTSTGITRLQFDRKRPRSVNSLNKSVSADVGVGVSVVSASAENRSRNSVYSQKASILSAGLHSRAQISTRNQLQLLATNNTTTTSTTESSKPTQLDYILITDYNRPRKRTFWQKYGRILLIAIGISLSVACISVLIVAINCYRVTALKRRATVAITLPIPLLPEDQTLLHTEPDNPVPMLSVQTAGYAGMERLGVPTRTTLNSPPDDRGQYSCRMRVETLPAREILVRSETVIRSNNASSGCTSACMTTVNCSGSKNQQQQQQQQLLNQEHHNQHSHHQQHHHQYQQQHHHHQQQQHYQRMSAQQQEQQQQQQQQQSACSSALSARNGSMPARSTTSISNSNSSSNFMRGGIEAATLKYGSMGSGSGGGGGGGGYGNSITGSSCGSNSSCNSHSIDHHQHYQQAKQLKQQRTPRCPHHVPLPDSEWGQDRSMQIRASYQQSELTRSYIKPPPNKTIKDVPEQSSYNFNALSALSGSNMTLYAAPATLTVQPQPPKSKPNVITKLFSRKSSPKSPTALASSSSSTSANSSLPSSASIASMPASASSSASSLASTVGGAAISASALSPSVSTSSSPSSLASAPLASMPISTASTLKTTACQYGASSLQSSAPPSITAGLATSTQLLTTIGVSPTVTPAAIERIPTPPLSVTVPIGGYHHHQHYHHHHHNQQQRLYQQQQQQILLDSIVAESATPTTSLQSLKSSSCSLATATAGAAERNSSRNSLVAMDCYPLTAVAASGGLTPRSRTPTAAADDNGNGCNCNNKDCKTCTPNAST